MDESLKGKTAVITGGGTGIGRCCTLQLADLGCNCVISYSRSVDEAERTVKDVQSKGVKGIAVKSDISIDADARNLSRIATKTFGGIDILINNAGTTRFIEMEDLEGVGDEAWDAIMNVNVKGTFYMSRACAPALKDSNGVIVIVTSIAGFMGRGSSLPYAVSKGALITLTKALARSLAPEVRVNAVAPGIVNTRWVAGKEEHVARQSEGTLLKRVAEAGDVAEVILGFIKNSGFVTGQTLIVDGGFYL